MAKKIETKQTVVKELTFEDIKRQIDNELTLELQAQAEKYRQQRKTELGLV